MSRSGYTDDLDDHWEHIRWRGAVKSAIRGKRGQAFLREMLAALDALPERRLITNKLEADGKVCALGAVGRARGLDMSGLDPEDAEAIADVFGVPRSLVREITFMNDEWLDSWEPSDALFSRMRAWIASLIKGTDK